MSEAEREARRPFFGYSRESPAAERQRIAEQLAAWWDTHRDHMDLGRIVGPSY